MNQIIKMILVLAVLLLILFGLREVCKTIALPTQSVIFEDAKWPSAVTILPISNKPDDSLVLKPLSILELEDLVFVDDGKQYAAKLMMKAVSNTALPAKLSINITFVNSINHLRNLFDKLESQPQWLEAKLLYSPGTNSIYNLDLSTREEKLVYSNSNEKVFIDGIRKINDKQIAFSEIDVLGESEIKLLDLATGQAKTIVQDARLANYINSTSELIYYKKFKKAWRLVSAPLNSPDKYQIVSRKVNRLQLGNVMHVPLFNPIFLDINDKQLVLKSIYDYNHDLNTLVFYDNKTKTNSFVNLQDHSILKGFDDLSKATAIKFLSKDILIYEKREFLGYCSYLYSSLRRKSSKLNCKGFRTGELIK